VIHRLELRLRPRTFQRLCAIRDRIEATSYLDVIAEALRRFESELDAIGVPTSVRDTEISLAEGLTGHSEITSQ